MALSLSQVRAAVAYNIRRSFEIEIIRRIQRTVGVTADGVFGPVTVNAVAVFQESHGLFVDGKVGPKTLSAFQEVWAHEPGSGLSPQEIQRALRYNRARGYAPTLVTKIQQTVGSAETGEFNEQTVVAVAAWQSQHDLIADGMVGPNTLRAMQASWEPEPIFRTVYRIHPGIGIARVGDSPTEYFIGPESPSRVAPEPPHRDATGFIKRQGARFRVYAYKYDQAGVLSDVHEVASDEAQIHWTVQLVNRKAAAPNFPTTAVPSRRNPGVDEASLIIDSGAQSVSGQAQHVPLQGAFLGSAVRLGDLRTDDAGRLIVLGGHGVSRSPQNRPMTNFANNDGWHDDVSDGPVRARLVLPSGATVDAESAWVVVAVPRYAPEISNVTTWWDYAYQMAARLDSALLVNRPSFTKHIYPILERVSRMAWVSGTVRNGHGPGTQWDFLSATLLPRLASTSPEDRTLRDRVYQSLRRPDGTGRNMPLWNTGINPDNPEAGRPTTLTDMQLSWMEQWALGQFEADWTGEPAPRDFDAIPPAEQPAALDRAALESCIGGPFYPGIEASYLIARLDTYGAPFRIASGTQPGALTGGLAVPWQADFHACAERWWPAQRPVSVFREGSATPVPWMEGSISRDALITAWADLGFIRRSGERFVERERTLPVPNV